MLNETDALCPSVPARVFLMTDTVQVYSPSFPCVANRSLVWTLGYFGSHNYNSRTLGEGASECVFYCEMAEGPWKISMGLYGPQILHLGNGRVYKKAR